MAVRKWTNADSVLSIANVLGVVAIVMIAAAIGTERWLVITVDRVRLTPQQRNSSGVGDSALYYHTRQRGMFRECYPGSDTVFLDTSNDVVDKNCFLITLIDNTAGSYENYRMKVGLHTAHVVMFLLGEVVLIIAYILGVVLCVGKMGKYAWSAAIFSFFAAFLLTLGMALFHGALYVEKEEVTTQPQGQQLSYQNWPQELQHATSMDYRESYIVAWVAIGFVLITCLCYVLVARMLPKKAKKPELKNGYPAQQIMYAPEQTRQPMVYYLT